MPRIYHGCLALALAFSLSAAEESALPPPGYQLFFKQDFDNADALKGFAFSDPEAWKWHEAGDSGTLELARQSQYKPAVRSPFNIALISGHAFGDFILEADLKQTGKEYGHRDMCIFFGFENPQHFYYVHLATAADDHAHNIFLVNDAPRVKIADKTSAGVNWGLDVWHRVRVERRLEEGTIVVFFDDMTKPVMSAKDTTFKTGHVGFGSFDDTGMVDHVRIWAPKTETRTVPAFK